MSRKSILKLCTLVLAVAVCIALFFLDPSQYTLAPKCPFKLLTGFSCPGCGVQRAAHAALHGRWATAWHYNPFLLYSIPWFVSVVLAEWGSQGAWRTKLKKVVESRPVIYLYILLFFAWGIVRNICGI